MLIYDALKKDHVKVLGLIDELIALGDKDESRDALVQEIRGELIPHSRAEEKLFYNSIRALDADSGKVMHSFNEHVAAETLLRSLQVTEKLNLGWKKTAIALRDALTQHIRDEETEVFALAKKVLSTEEAEQIGLAFERLKPEIKEEGFMKTTLEMISNMMPPRLNKTLLSEKR